MKKEKLYEILEENVSELHSVVSSINCFNGSLEFLEAIPMDELDGYLEGYTPTDIINKMFYGNFNPMHEYFRFNAYANLESFTSWDLEKEYKTYLQEIVNAIYDTDMLEEVLSYLGIEDDEDDEEE